MAGSCAWSHPARAGCLILLLAVPQSEQRCRNWPAPIRQVLTTEPFSAFLEHLNDLLYRPEKQSADSTLLRLA